MVGKELCSQKLKKLQRDIRIKKPDETPRQNAKFFLKPFWLALYNDIMLLGPGVNETTNA